MRNPFKLKLKLKLKRTQPAPETTPAPPVDSVTAISNSLTGFALRNPHEAQRLYERLNPTSPTHENTLALLRSELTADPDSASRIMEQINPTAIASSPTQEDWYWGRLATGDEEDYYWRRLSDNWYQKDVIPSTYLEIHNQCYEAYNANPLAFAVIEITTSFVLGKGVKVVGKTPVIQKCIDAFWNAQKMDSRVYDICTELALYGEIFVRFFINKFSGDVAIRMIDPSIIDQVETDPDDIEHQLRIHRRPIGPSPTQTMDAVSGTLDRQALTGQNPGDPTMQGEWFKIGSENNQVLHYKINSVSNAKRGKSDLATLLPWLRRYKDWLTDRVRINKYKGAFLWDVKLTGADAKTIARKKMDYSYPPEPGSVIIHNEAEEWAATQPNINAQDAKEDGRAIKLMVAVGATLPEHFLSDGDNNTRATAAEMGLPTFLKFQRRQHAIKAILQDILERVVIEAQKHGLNKKIDPCSAFDILFPEFDFADNLEIGGALNVTSQALTTARGNGWLTDESAAQYLYKMMGQELDVHKELAAAKAQQLDRQVQAVQNAKDMAAAAPAPAPTPVVQKGGTPPSPTPPEHKAQPATRQQGSKS